MKAPLPDLFGNKSPQTDDEWNQLDYRAADIFSPHSPIDEEELFVGRIDLVEGLIETVFQRGQHAILYGERGVGKTSLANIIGTKLFTKSKRFSIIKRNCTEAHDFKLNGSIYLTPLMLETARRSGKTCITTQMHTTYINV
jgi:Cdc6-like AAA superfamily ATPase